MHWMKRQFIIMLIGLGALSVGEVSQAQDQNILDTVRLDSLPPATIPGLFVMSVKLMADEDLQGITVPLVFTHQEVGLDSVSFVGGMTNMSPSPWALQNADTTDFFNTRQVNIGAVKLLFEPDVNPGIDTDSLFCRLYCSVPDTATAGDLVLDTMLFPPFNRLRFAAPSAPVGIFPQFVKGKIGIGQEYTLVTEYTAGGTTPTDYRLSQNYPNPFNAGTVIEYTLPRDGQVKLEVLNILGQRVATLVDGFRSLGRQTVSWDGTDDRGRAISTGVYFYRLSAADFTSTKKMVMLK